MRNVMQRCAVFIRGYSIGKSSPVLCLLDLLSDHYQVDLYVKEGACLTATVLKKPALHIVSLDGVMGLWRTFSRRCRGLLFPVAAGAAEEYRHYICFDPHGFLLGKDLFPAARPVYYSLELYLRTNHFNLPYPPEVMEREHREISGIRGLIIQSEEREAVFRKEYSLPDQIPSFLLPVSYLTSSVQGKSDLLRKRYGISPQTKIALHLGGIRPYFSCIELALAFSRVPGYALVFHGHPGGGYIEKLKGVIAERRLANVYISDEPFDLIEEMDPIVQSCDLGLAWYNDVSPNFATAGKSSGKISAYLRFGLPVIAKRYPSTVEALEECGCGLCVNDFAAIPDAVAKIDADLATYSENCRKEYDREYWFENYRKGLIEFLERL